MQIRNWTRSTRRDTHTRGKTSKIYPVDIFHPHRVGSKVAETEITWQHVCPFPLCSSPANRDQPCCALCVSVFACWDAHCAMLLDKEQMLLWWQYCYFRRWWWWWWYVGPRWALLANQLGGCAHATLKHPCQHYRHSCWGWWWGWGGWGGGWRQKVAQICVKMYYIVALGIYINILVHQMFA